jgi:hypothetical protein
MKFINCFLFFWVIFALLDPEPIRMGSECTTLVFSQCYGSGSAVICVFVKGQFKHGFFFIYLEKNIATPSHWILLLYNKYYPSLISGLKFEYDGWSKMQRRHWFALVFI